MEYFQVRYDSRVVIYDRKMFIRLATGVDNTCSTIFASNTPLTVNFSAKVS